MCAKREEILDAVHTLSLGTWELSNWHGGVVSGIRRADGRRQRWTLAFQGNQRVAPTSPLRRFGTFARVWTPLVVPPTPQYEKGRARRIGLSPAEDSGTTGAVTTLLPGLLRGGLLTDKAAKRNRLRRRAQDYLFVRTPPSPPQNTCPGQRGAPPVLSSTRTTRLWGPGRRALRRYHPVPSPDYPL